MLLRLAAAVAHTTAWSRSRWVRRRGLVGNGRLRGRNKGIPRLTAGTVFTLGTPVTAAFRALRLRGRRWRWGGHSLRSYRCGCLNGSRRRSRRLEAELGRRGLGWRGILFSALRPLRALRFLRSRSFFNSGSPLGAFGLWSLLGARRLRDLFGFRLAQPRSARATRFFGFAAGGGRRRSVVRFGREGHVGCCERDGGSPCVRRTGHKEVSRRTH